MSTKFTKEQLIEKAKENVEFFRERLELLPQSQPVALSLHLAEIALASLEAEPVAWLWSTPFARREVSLISPDCDELSRGAIEAGWSYQPLAVCGDKSQELDNDQ